MHFWYGITMLGHNNKEGQNKQMIVVYDSIIYVVYVLTVTVNASTEVEIGLHYSTVQIVIH